MFVIEYMIEIPITHFCTPETARKFSFRCSWHMVGIWQEGVDIPGVESLAGARRGSCQVAPSSLDPQGLPLPILFPTCLASMCLEQCQVHTWQTLCSPRIPAPVSPCEKAKVEKTGMEGPSIQPRQGEGMGRRSWQEIYQPEEPTCTGALWTTASGSTHHSSHTGAVFSKEA